MKLWPFGSEDDAQTEGEQPDAGDPRLAVPPQASESELSKRPPVPKAKEIEATRPGLTAVAAGLDADGEDGDEGEAVEDLPLADVGGGPDLDVGEPAEGQASDSDEQPATGEKPVAAAEEAAAAQAPAEAEVDGAGGNGASIPADGEGGSSEGGSDLEIEIPPVTDPETRKETTGDLPGENGSGDLFDPEAVWQLIEQAEELETTEEAVTEELADSEVDVDEIEWVEGGTGEELTEEQLQEYRELYEEQRRMVAERELAEAKKLEELAEEKAQRAREAQQLEEELEEHDEFVRSIAEQLDFDPDRPVTPIPPLEHDEQTEVEFQEIEEDRAYVRIVYDQRRKEYRYQVIEPELTDVERDVLGFLKETLYKTMDGRYGAPTDEDWEDYLSEAVDKAIIDHNILVDRVAKERLKYYVLRDFLGYGPIDVLMNDPMIEDISCDGPEIPIYIFHRQYESIRTNLVFDKEKKLDGFVIRLAQLCGKHISLAEPLLDATLPDTSRLQASLSKEVTTRGSSFTIRKFRADPLTPPDLIRLGTLSAEMAGYLWLAMEMEQSIIYGGGTASGKTTTLNAVGQFIPPHKKIVSIEDTREINLEHENWIASISRPGFRDSGGEDDSGAIDMYQLLEAALRQRPEYLLVGEVRGGEARTLFQAMSTGHATYSTLHADSVTSAVHRLENPPINVPRMMLQTLDLMAIQIQTRIGDRMVRRMKNLSEIVGIDPESGDLLTNTVFRWDGSEDRHVYTGASHTLEEIMERRSMTRDEIEEEWGRRATVLRWLAEENIRHIDDVADVVRAYYRYPEEVLIKARAGLGMEQE